MVIAFGVMGLVSGAIAIVWSRLSLEDVTYERQLPEQHVFIGDVVRITLALTNKKPLPLPWVRVEDQFPEALEVIGGDVVENMYARVQWLRHSTSLAWYERVCWHYQIRCTRRGLYRIGPATIESGDPFGFMSNRISEPGRDSILVYPRVISLPELGVPAARPLGETRGGIRMFQDPSRPMGLREYQRGDPLNAVDWKATARLQRIQVRTFEPSSALTVIVVVAVDTTERYWTADRPDALERVVTAAASFASYAIEQDHVLGLFSNDMQSIGGRSMTVPSGRGREQLGHVMRALAIVRSLAVSPMASHLAEYSRAFPVGATIVVSTAFIAPGLVEALRDLKKKGYKIVVLYVGEGSCPDLGDGILVHELREHLENMEGALEFGPR